VEYSFDEVTNKLTLKHINAAFNCCPESIYCKIELLDDTIAVQEFEKKSGCKCDCIYDLDIEISGVEKKKYQLKILEPYVQEQSELKLEVDLMKESVGSFCVTRKQYPWGM